MDTAAEHGRAVFRYPHGLSMILRLLLACLLIAPLPGGAADAAPAPFDLTGPALRVTVTHGGATLPIAQVPNLSSGDHLSIAADVHRDGSARYLLVAGFLRGATDPPPKNWFFRAETWQRKNNGLSITVPGGARQLVLFLVPETGGAFGAIVDAVRKQPGAFVRASQELNQASLDRARLDRFLQAIRGLERSSPERINTVSPLLTRSLAIKLRAECLEQAPGSQAACLTESRDTLLLADTHSSSLAETLIGAPADLAFQLSATPQAGYGYYSPYVGVVRDLARIFGAFQSTQLQYIPALARVRDDRITLLLNAAPSFARPKSVMVVALPAIEPPQPPPLRLSEPESALCATRPDLLLPVQGAPLVYATDYAHAMVLRLAKPDGGTVDLPVTADPERGGYVLRQEGTSLAAFGATIDARLHGRWGFAPFDGPQLRLQNPRPGGWRPVDGAAASLVVGRDNGLVLHGSAPACVDGIDRQGTGVLRPVTWKAVDADRIALAIPLAGAAPGGMTLRIRQHGIATADSLSLTALSEAGRIDGFTLHAGDAGGVLIGTRLDTVASLSVDGLVFRPGDVARAGGVDRLPLVATDAAVARSWAAGQERKAKIIRVDGRTRTVPFAVAAARPVVALLERSVERAPSDGRLAITFADGRALPDDARLTFSLRAEGQTRFSGADSVEIAAADGRASMVVSAATGLTIQNDRIAVVIAEPGRSLGASAYGPLRFRMVRNGVAGDWTPLATLVRLPILTDLACGAGDGSCTLTGARLFLIAAISDDPGFADASAIPDGLTGRSATTPNPAGGKLFLRLRDAADLEAVVTLRRNSGIVDKG